MTKMSKNFFDLNFFDLNIFEMLWYGLKLWWHGKSQVDDIIERYFKKTDADAIRSDWEYTGDDIQNTIAWLKGKK